MKVHNRRFLKLEIQNKIMKCHYVQLMCVSLIFAGAGLSLIDRQPMPPERKIYVLLFNIGMLVLCGSGWWRLEVKKRSLNDELRASEKLESSNQNRDEQNKAPVSPPL